MKPLKAVVAALAISTCLPVPAHAQSCRDVVVKVRNHELRDVKVSDVEYTISGRSEAMKEVAERKAEGRACEVWSRSTDRAGNERIQLTIRYSVPNWTGWTGKGTAVISWKVCNDGDEFLYGYRDGWAVPSCD